MQNFKIITTGDGSKSLIHVELNEMFHSTHGAATESEIVFIQHGLSRFTNDNIKILEIGYGTGLNAILSYTANRRLKNHIDYHAVDNTILPDELYRIHRNISDIEDDLYEKFLREWDTKITIDQNFSLTKHCYDITRNIPINEYNLVYFDAFSPEKQAELWTDAIFEKLYNMLVSGGALVTYSSKGLVKQALRNAGFTVRRLPGPPRKRHVLRAEKP